MEIKVEVQPNNKEHVLKMIAKRLGQKQGSILNAKHPFIFSFTFPNFSGELSEEDWFIIKKFITDNNMSKKISLLTLTQFKA